VVVPQSLLSKEILLESIRYDSMDELELVISNFNKLVPTAIVFDSESEQVVSDQYFST
jgi:hypothetical protein